MRAVLVGRVVRFALVAGVIVIRHHKLRELMILCNDVLYVVVYATEV